METKPGDHPGEVGLPGGASLLIVISKEKRAVRGRAAVTARESKTNNITRIGLDATARPVWFTSNGQLDAPSP